MSQNIEIERRLAAVLAADVAGFSRLTEADEVGTMRMLAAQRAILDGAIARHRGRIANTAGDSVLAEFPSAVNAVQCAVEAQQALRDAAEGAPADRRVLFRIGIHVGDVMVRSGDLLGNGVNVAARLEALADAGGIVLSAATHEQVKKILPLAYSDLGPQRVKNIEEPVRAFAIGGTATAIVASALAEPGKPLPLPDKPSIAVLPFQNMSGDPEQEYFADGMVEDIITALSRFKSLFVIARNSSFTYKGKAVDIKQVGRELGVRYVLEGSVRKAGGQVRVTGQLIEASTNNHLWADKFDGPLQNIFELQDQVAAKVVGAVAPNVESAEALRASVKPTENLGAYDCYLHGREALRTFSMEGTATALGYFRRAIAFDPAYARAYGWGARCIHNRRSYAWKGNAEQEIVEGTELAERAVALGTTDAEALTPAANYLGFIGHRHEYAANIIDQALSLNPNLADAWRVRGLISVWIGQSDEGIRQLETALRLSPIGPDVFSIYAGLGQAYLYSGRPSEALAWYGKSLVLQPNWAGSLRNSIVAYVALGRMDEARSTAEHLLKLAPELTVSAMRRMLPYRRAEDMEMVLGALRTAGIPE